ncbi:hypothetical protein EW146_g9411 [Bondarzewia mesenterica]|uniref:DNA-directed RNA polymerase RBP11-like dimerisation domain-containing protein n=1 Tax=Bondarzewia mesenterica TaxID=1095465 RepID=A0A4S4L712_9AGAM|nr:hypothetical protein EW146_g9411 [Bondarzewia mesenterica]
MKGAEPDLSAATYQIFNETHTLGNALRWMLMKNPMVEFCGYSAPHPSENLIQLRIQMYDNLSSLTALQNALNDLDTLFESIEEAYIASVKHYPLGTVQGMRTGPEEIRLIPRTSQQMNSSSQYDFKPIGHNIHALFNEHYAKRDAAVLQKVRDSEFKMEQMRDECMSLRAQYDASQVENQWLHAEIALLREQNMEVTEHAMHADLLLQQASTDHASIFEPAGSPVQTVSDGMQTPPPSLPAECSNQEVNLNTATLVPPPATIMDSSEVTVQVPDSTTLSTACSSELEENSDSEITDHSDSSGEESGSDNELTPHTIRYVPDNGGIFYIDRHTEPRRRVGRPLKRPRLLNEAPATRADSTPLAHNASEPLPRMMGAPAKHWQKPSIGESWGKSNHITPVNNTPEAASITYFFVQRDQTQYQKAKNK